jgi:hypothetical protein
MAYPRQLTKPAARKATTPRSSTRTKAALGALRKKARPAAKIAAAKMAAPKRVTPKRAVPKMAAPKKKALDATLKAAMKGFEARLRKQKEAEVAPPRWGGYKPMPPAKVVRTAASKKRSAKSAATELSRLRKSAADLRRKRAAQRRRRR